MGNTIARIWRAFSSKRDYKILMLGLDSAGKTTICVRMHLGEVVMTVPTIGFNVETVEYRNIKFNMWDVGGQDVIRPLWRYYYAGNDGIIFVVDSCDRERLTGPIEDSESKAANEELAFLLSQDELRGCPVLVFANKQDRMEAATVSEVTEGVQIEKSAGAHREWFVQGCSARTGDGLYEGLDWLGEAIERRNRSKA